MSGRLPVSTSSKDTILDSLYSGFAMPSIPRVPILNTVMMINVTEMAFEIFVALFSGLFVVKTKNVMALKIRMKGMPK